MREILILFISIIIKSIHAAYEYLCNSISSSPRPANGGVGWTLDD